MILIIGPIPDPVNGCSLANQVLVNRLSLAGISYEVINMSAPIQASSSMGKFSFRKVAFHLRAYRKIFLIRKADVVYATPGQTFLGILKYAPYFLLCRLLDIPYVVHLHGNHLGREFRESGPLKRRIMKFCLRGAAKGIVLSESLRSNFDHLIEPDRIEVVENFVEDDMIPLECPQKGYSQLKFLFLSNLMKEKGFEDFLLALRILKERRISFVADIAGKPEWGGSRDIFGEFSDLKDSIKYHGVVGGEKKRQLLREANVFVLPTYYRMEGQPITLIEAMANGNIVVSTRFSGIPDIVSESNGFFVLPENPEDLANVLTGVANDLQDIVREISVYNYEYASERFKESRFYEKLVFILNHVSESKRI
jgi:glycosyltransferase involved in cell wall biosynthesis